MSVVESTGASSSEEALNLSAGGHALTSRRTYDEPRKSRWRLYTRLGSQGGERAHVTEPMHRGRAALGAQDLLYGDAVMDLQAALDAHISYLAKERHGDSAYPFGLVFLDEENYPSGTVMAVHIPAHDGLIPTASRVPIIHLSKTLAALQNEEVDIDIVRSMYHAIS